MKRLSLLAFLLLFAAPVFCQVELGDIVSADNESLFQPKKLTCQLTLGSQFTSSSGFGSGLTTYVTPRLSYRLNNRLSIGGGVSIIQTGYFKARSYFQQEPAAVSNGNFTGALIFVDGTYLVNNRLSVYGSAYKQLPITQDPLPYNPFNPVSAHGAQGVNLNVSYRIGNNVFIQAGFHYAEGMNPHATDPFNRNPFLNNTYEPYSAFGTPRW